MSYILKALRKAEQDRQAASPATAADFLGHAPVDPVGGVGRGKNVAILVLSVLLVGCAVYLLATLGNGRETATAAPVAESVARIETPNVAPAETVEERPSPVRGETSVSPGDQAATPHQSQPQPEPPVPEPPAPEPLVAEAAPAVPEQLPHINITGYIFFDDNPERSKLFVDGIVYRLGSRIDSGLVVTGFAKDEVTVSYQGREHRIQVH